MRLGAPDDPVLLDASLMGGQAFRWQPRDGGYVGVALGRQWFLRPLRTRGRVEARADPRARAEVLRHYLRLDDDYAAACVRLTEDPVLAEAVAAYRGLRLLRQDPWETLAAFVTSANNNVKRISLCMERLARAAGEPREGAWGAYHAFPSPRAVAALGEDALRRLGFGYRAPYLARTAERVASGRVDLVALREDADREDAVAALTALPGVGPKVADCVALFALDKTDAFPVDRWVQRVVADAYPEARALAPRDVAAFARARWGADAGLAQQFLFHAARMRGRSGVL